MRAALFSKIPSKAIELTKFSGEHSSKIANGQLFDSDNVSVLNGGAICSMLAERKVDINAFLPSLSEGVYSLCEFYDSEYETHVSKEWIYQNICPQAIMAYQNWQLDAARIFVKDIGQGAKNNGGYRRVINAFTHGDNIFIFYEACYRIIDERRSFLHYNYSKGNLVQFNSDSSGDKRGSVNVYTISQMFLDVIDKFGNVETALIDANLALLETIENSSYLKSTLVSTDGVNYKYTSFDYMPHIGVSYNSNYDRLYTEKYLLDNEYPSVYFSYGDKKRTVRYCNIDNGEGQFDSRGEKLLILPDMCLFSKENGEWSFSERGHMFPKFSAAVQYFDRLFGINGDTVYASVAGMCTDFVETSDGWKRGAWRMVTSDEGGFTAITEFGGKVVVFTAESMMTVRGNELPFTLSFVGHFGCVSQDALTTLDGMLYFVSREGVMCYNGSSVKKISAALPRDVDFSRASLTSENGTLVLYIGDFSLWFYEPSSEEWSRRKFDKTDVTFLGGTVLARGGAVSSLHRLFDDFGNFSFAVALENEGCRKIKSISVTASAGIDSELVLTDKNGRALMSIYDTDGIVTRTFLPRAFYLDHGKIHFEGRGECTLYSIRIEYAKVAAFKRKE